MPADQREDRILLFAGSTLKAESISRHCGPDSNSRIEWIQTPDAFRAAILQHPHAVLVVDDSRPHLADQTPDQVLRLSGGTPVIFVSGVARGRLVCTTFARGAEDYVTECAFSDLFLVIDHAVRMNRERIRRIRAEAALQAVNDTLDSLVALRSRGRDRIWRLSHELFAVLDANGAISAANPSWWRILGLHEDQIVATTMRAVVHSEDWSRFDAMLQTLGSNQPVEHTEMRMKRRDGAFRWISWTAVPQGGEIYAVGRDITEIRQSAEALEAATANLKLETAERHRAEATVQHLQRIEAIGHVAAGVAHDFNNLLAIVLGTTAVLERLTAGRPDAPELVHLARIRRAVEGGTRVARQLLAFSRPQPLLPQSLHLNQVVSEIQDLLKSSLGGDIQFKTLFDASLWVTWADRTQLEMALLNLVVNARDAMPAGGAITVQTAIAAFASGATPEGLNAGEYVSVCVSDTGTGIPFDILKKIFEPYYTTKEAGLGSGLGLSQVSEFAKRSSGAVRVDTEVGKGTQVWVYLPRAGSSVTEKPVSRTPPLAATMISAAGLVMVVDDDPAARAVTASILEEAGHSVFEASSGAMALEALQTQPIDVLVTDYAMPVMNGAETARLALSVNPSLRILILTGYADLPGLKGIREYRLLEKPCGDDELRQAVAAELLEARSLTANK